jgi:hypothetical protein
MALTAKPPVAKNAHGACGSCDKSPPRFLCPTCPRRASQSSDDDHGWARLGKTDPELCAVQVRCAQTARAIAITHESHPEYPEYLAAHRAAGDARDALWMRRRREAPPPKPAKPMTGRGEA